MYGHIMYIMCNVCMFSTDLSSYGWQREKEQLQVVWDSEENLQQVHRTVEYLTKGSKRLWDMTL